VEQPPVEVPVAVAAQAVSTRAKAREGKKAVVGYFSEELSLTLRRLALDEGSSMQAVLGEAIDLLMRDRNKHPFGER
jgi:hypothetical protein